MKKKLIEKIEKEEKSGEIVLLKDNLDNMLDVFEINFNTDNFFKNS